MSIKPIYIIPKGESEEKDIRELDIYAKMNSVEDAMILEGITAKRDKWNHYSFQNTNVPRVTEILEQCIGKKYLIKWALKLGQDYDKESRITLAAGTFTHELIEYYLINRCKKDMNIYSYRVKELVDIAYENFVSWYIDKESKGYIINPIKIEYPIVTPYFGGTCDCIMNIRKDNISYNCLMDFKTSKQISVDYFLQTYFYLWGLNWLGTYCDASIPEIDSIGIIRVDKFTLGVFEDMILKLDSSENVDFLSSLNYSFSSILNWFYNYNNIDYCYRINKQRLKNIDLEE